MVQQLAAAAVMLVRAACESNLPHLRLEHCLTVAPACCLHSTAPPNYTSYIDDFPYAIALASLVVPARRHVQRVCVLSPATSALTSITRVTNMQQTPLAFYSSPTLAFHSRTKTMTDRDHKAATSSTAGASTSNDDL